MPPSFASNEHGAAAPPSTDDFFNLEREQRALHDWLRREPSSILLLVGPPSSGKTRLLKHVLVDPPGGRPEGQSLPTLYIEARVTDITSAEGMRAALRENVST